MEVVSRALLEARGDQTFWEKYKWLVQFLEAFISYSVCLPSRSLPGYLLGVDGSQDIVSTPNSTRLSITDPRIWAFRLIIGGAIAIPIQVVAGLF